MTNRRFFLALLTLVWCSAGAASLPYDGDADASAAVQHGLADARAAGRPLLIIFGANWCEDCRALDSAIKNPKNSTLISESFVVVKVDVGRFDHNMDLAGVYGNPVAKGIPAAVIVSPDNAVLYATRAGELADARRMSESGIYDFFRAAVEKSSHAPATATGHP